MFNAEENDGSKHVVQDVLSVSTPDSHNQLLRENQKLKQELAEAREELKRLKEVLGGKEEHKKTMEQDAEFHVRYWQPEEHQVPLTHTRAIPSSCAASSLPHTTRTPSNLCTHDPDMSAFPRNSASSQASRCMGTKT
jgi:hypothetical protein